MQRTRRRRRDHVEVDQDTQKRLAAGFRSGKTRYELSEEFGLPKEVVIIVLDRTRSSTSGVNKAIRRQLARCAHCGSRESLTRDHIRPISKGGSNDPRNIQILCVGCNNKKDSYWDGKSGWPKT